MKICFLYDSVFTLGGIQRCITNMANYLSSIGYEVDIVCTRKSEIDRSMYNLSDNVNVIFTPKLSKLEKAIKQYRKPLIYLNKKTGIFKNSLFILKKIYYPYHFGLRKLLNKNNYDVVVSSAPYCNTILSILKLNKKTIKIGWQHSSHMFYFEQGWYKYQDAIVKNMFKNLDSYVVLNNDDKNKIKRDYGFNVKTIYNSLSFKQGSKKCKYDNKIFIAAGRLSKEKRFDLLIKNFYEFNKKNKEWHLQIYGEGEEKNKLLNLIDNLNLKDYVSLLPFTNDIMSKYLQSSIYCMSSISEGFGMVVIEAMESGLPIISYNIPCMNEIIKDAGFVVKNDNNYIETMINLSKNKDLYKKLSLNSKRNAKFFYIENISKKWISLFNDLKEKINNEEKNN